jgi:transmembrane sensor
VDLEQIKKLLERYSEGKSTTEENEVITQWFEDINHQQQTPISEEDLKTDLSQVQQTLLSRIQPPARRRNLRPWYAVAAAIALLITASAWWMLQRPASKPDTHMLAKTSRTVSGNFMIINTVKGDTTQVTLADGSHIQINAGTRLRYPINFNNGPRDIYLEEGEATFYVAPDPGHAFTVHTAQLNATALGTSFNVRAYAREQKITVALISGKVSVNNLILLPSEQASYDLHTLQLVKTSFRNNTPVSWQAGNLVFNDASYEEVRTEIENRFGVTLVNQSDKQRWTYTGSFHHENLRNVIETICLTESLSYAIEKDTVLLKNK